MTDPFSRLPHFTLFDAPTPLHEMTRLRAAIKEQNGTCPQLFIKRDDMTDLAGGGNKTRKLEYLIGDARKQNADTIVTAGALQSNHARQTAAAAAKAGLSSVLILFDTVPYEGAAYRRSGNLLLDNILGARLVIEGKDADPGEVFSRVMEEIISEGGTPYLIPVGGSNSIGALGYARAAGEILDQAAARKLDVTRILHASSSLGTQAGLLAGLAARASDVQVTGINVYRHDTQQMREDLVDLTEKTTERLGSRRVGAERFELVDGYLGEAYGVPTPEMKAAISTLAQAEGILLDPVYSGKAMAGLIGMIFRGEIGPDETVLFLHTGGMPGLFAYEGEFAA
ncbi:D-cysteine desulfhydrase family protein [Tepidicaulis sp. LMO-SS28]|uniref:D-cysteine desulfhydrase family protein n=1 Tax=Tepidicaulis sp. LMO-SS28 TaxID=3447455 RepID=UPI003EE2E0AF